MSRWIGCHPEPQTKKHPPNSKSPCGVGFVFSVACQSSRERAVGCFDGVVAWSMPIMILMGNTSIFLYSTIYNKRRGRISLPRRNVLRKSLRFCPSPLAVGSQNRTASGENSRCNKKAHPAFRQDARKIACGHFQANGINLVHFAPKLPVLCNFIS